MQVLGDDHHDLRRDLGNPELVRDQRRLVALGVQLDVNADEQQLGDDEILTVTVHGHTPDGREDFDIGAVSLRGLSGEARANATKEAVTQGKRRLTLSLIGLEFLDESEVEAAGGVAVDLDPETGEIRQAERPASLLAAVNAQRDRLAALPEAGQPDEPAEGAIFADTTAEASAPDLLAALRDAAGRSGLQGDATPPQQQRLKAAFAGMPVAAIQGGIRAAFGHDRLAGAAEAQAVITAADSLGDEPFRAEWAALAAAS